MKLRNKLHFLSALILSTAVLSCQPVVAQTKDQLEYCKQLKSISGSIMWHRQEVNSILEAAEIAKGDALILSIVEAAYSLPKYASEEFKEQAAKDFSAEVEQMCYNSIKSEGKTKSKKGMV